VTGLFELTARAKKQRAEIQAEKESQYEHQMVPKLQVSESRRPSLIRG
jgi:hypothetical protein